MIRFVPRTIAICALLPGLPAHAMVVNFTEDFVVDAAGWADVGFAALSFSATGGPAGAGDSFVSGQRNFFASPNNFATTIIRGHDSLNSSGKAFVGDWIDSGVVSFSYFVRHNAGVPLTFAARFASPLNSPGANATFGTVDSGVWTEVTFDVTSSSPQFTSFEGSDYNTVFGNVGNVQLTARPDSLLGVDQDVTFDFDDVSVAVPEGAAGTLLAIGVALTFPMLARRRRRRL